MATTPTTAQATRLAQIHREIAGTGSRITTRKLSGGRLQVTEHNRGTKTKDVLVLDADGHYPALVINGGTTETDTDEAPAGVDVEDATVMVIATIVNGLAPADLQGLRAHLTADERLLLDSSARQGRVLLAA